MDNQNILAVVAGEEITQKDLDALIAALPKEQQAYAGNEHFRNQCLEQIITVHLFAKLGEELKLEETEAFADNLAHAKREILAQMALGEAMKDITVSEEEAKEYTNMLRAQLTKNQLVLLAYNAIGVQDFATNDYQLLVEKYSFFEHLRYNDFCENANIIQTVNTILVKYADKAFDKNQGLIDEIAKHR